MVVAERIGHDKRGKAVYRRSPTGEELVEPVSSGSLDPITGLPRPTSTPHLRRVIDDELPDVAQAYTEWLRRER